jgi:RNA polymerase sigma factor (sigma-70 family)
MTFAGSSMTPEELSSHLNARFRGPLLTFFQRRVKDHALAQDLTQEVLLRVMQAVDRQRIENPESFVFRVAANLLYDQKRRYVRDGEPAFIPIDDAVETELEQELVEDWSPERVLLGRDSLFEVIRSLGTLSDRTRDIFVLYKIENMKQKDIAALYGINQSTVEKHVVKAVAYLMKRYGRP